MSVIIYEVITYEEKSYFDYDGCEFLRRERVEVNSFASKVEAVKIAQKLVARRYDEAYVYREKIGAKGIEERKCVYRKFYKDNA